MKKIKLTKEEQEIEEYINKGEYKNLLTPELKKYYQEIARYSRKLKEKEKLELEIKHLFREAMLFKGQADLPILV